MTKYLRPNMWAGEPGNMPGVGHEFRLWLTGYTLAEKHNCKFVHDPFCGDHTQTWDGVGRVDMPVAMWESFLNIGQGELRLADLSKDIPIIDLQRFPAGQSIERWRNIICQDYKNDVLFRCPFNQFIPMYWDIYADNRFKQKYWDRRVDNPVISHFTTDKMSVAVHIRRCDVTRQRYPDRYLSNEYYKKVLDQIRSVYPQSIIHIYSDAKVVDELVGLAKMSNTIFHLQTDIFETFHALASADIFVTGIGSFSILAAYMSHGVKVTTDWNNAWSNFPSTEKIVPAIKNGNLSVQLLVTELEKSNETGNV